MAFANLEPFEIDCLETTVDTAEPFPFEALWEVPFEHCLVLFSAPFEEDAALDPFVPLLDVDKAFDPLPLGVGIALFPLAEVDLFPAPFPLMD